MHTGYSPYDMTAEANRIIEESMSSGSFPLDSEKQVLALLNVAQNYPHMFVYQLSLAHKSLANLYYSLGITGSAMEHYEIALEMNPKIAVKKKLKELKSLPKELLSYSLDANSIYEPDYSNLTFHKIELDAEFIEYRQKQDERQAAYWGISIDEYNQKNAEILSSLQKEVEEANKIYDPEWEKEIEERLSKLNEQYKNEFYRTRKTQSNEGDILSLKELDRLALEAMEKSFHYYNK